MFGVQRGPFRGVRDVGSRAARLVVARRCGAGVAASIQGRVTDVGGTGFSGVQVRVYNLTAKCWPSQRRTTDGSGNYAATAATGDHLVDAAPPPGDAGAGLLRGASDSAAPLLAARCRIR